LISAHQALIERQRVVTGSWRSCIIAGHRGRWGEGGSLLDHALLGGSLQSVADPVDKDA
jgi:hypothetical protein